MQADLWDVARGPRQPLDLDRVARRAGASARRRRTIAGLLALSLALGLVAITVRRQPATSAPAPAPTPSSPAPTFTVESVRGLDAIVVLGAPVGPESTGTLVSLDPRTGVVLRRDHRGGLSPGDFP